MSVDLLYEIGVEEIPAGTVLPALEQLAAGVTAGREPGEVAVAALAAGEDLLLVVDPAQVEETVAAIVAAVATGGLPLERLQEASARVLRLAEAAAPITCPG